MKKFPPFMLFLSLLFSACLLVSSATAQDSGRKAKTRVEPVYPDVARQLDISGAVRLQVTVGPDGRVKQVKVLGGHPLLAEAASNAVKQWRFEPGPESIEIVFVEFKH